jgi:hypothetical protein
VAANHLTHLQGGGAASGTRSSRLEPSQLSDVCTATLAGTSPTTILSWVQALTLK